LGPRDVAVVREIYDGDDSEEIFRMELERALDVGCRTIVIEPSGLATYTSSWIFAGSYVKRASMLSGFSALVIGKAFHMFLVSV